MSSDARAATAARATEVIRRFGIAVSRAGAPTVAIRLPMSLCPIAGVVRTIGALIVGTICEGRVGPDQQHDDTSQENDNYAAVTRLHPILPRIRVVMWIGLSIY